MYWHIVIFWLLFNFSILYTSYIVIFFKTNNIYGIFQHCSVKGVIYMHYLVYGYIIVYKNKIYLQINTWAFPYWPGYHPETCIKLFITYFWHLEKRHPYWPETKSRPDPIWASIWKWSWGLGIITRPIWKCPCINLYLHNTIFRQTKHITKS
jgi:hypothetical protein